MRGDPGTGQEALVRRVAGGRLITPSSVLDGHELFIEAGIISRIAPANGAAEPAAAGRAIDATGCWVIPGLIDLHTHGAMGYDTMDGTPAALEAIASFGIRHGVTSFLATTMSAPAHAIRKAIESAAALWDAGGGRTILGVHLEGPYLSQDHRGAQPEAEVRHPDPAEYEPWLAHDAVRLMTIAPELPGTSDLIRRGHAQGVEFAVGHSGASLEESRSAIDLGVRHATHTFNGMPPLHHREPGVLGAALADDRVFAHAILDGVHLHPDVARILIRAKGVMRTILISDAMRATGLTDGMYELGGQPISVRDGVARTTSGGLAGSTLTLDRAIRNAVRWTGLSVPETVGMATQTPAAAMGLGGRKGVLAPGADADIVLLDGDLRVRLTIVGGRVAFESN